MGAAVDLGPFQQLALGDHAVELGTADELVVPAVHLTRPALPSGRRDAEPQVRVERAQFFDHAALTDARGAGQDNQPAPPLRATHSPPNSASNALRWRSPRPRR